MLRLLFAAASLLSASHATPSPPCLWDDGSSSGGAGWVCAGVSPGASPAWLRGVSLSDADDGGEGWCAPPWRLRLTVVGDSVARQAAADFALEALGCAPEPAAAATASAGGC